MRHKEIGRIEMRAPAKAAVWYFVGGAIGKAVGLIATPIFTRLLSSEEFATLPLFMTWVGLIGAACGVSGSLGARGKMLIEGEGRGEEISYAFFGYGIIQLLACMLLYFLLYPILSRLGAPSIGLSLFVFLQLILDTAIHSQTTRLKANYGYKRAVGISIFLSVAPVVISYIIISLFGARGEYRVIGSLIAGGALAVPIIFRALKGGRLYDKAVFRELFRTEAPLLPKNLASALLFSADRLMITAFFGFEALSAYTISHSVGAAGGFIVTALSAAATPWVIRRLSSGRTEGICETSDTAVLLLTLGAIMICGLAPELLGFLAPSGYDAPLSVIAPLTLSSVPLFLSGLLSGVAASEGHGFSAAMPGVITAVLSIMLNALLFSIFSIEVAGVGYFVANLLGLFIADAIRSRQGGERLFSKSRLTLSLFVGGALCLIALAYDYSLAMRATLILLAVVISLPLLLGFLVRVGIKRPPKSGGEGV